MDDIPQKQCAGPCGQMLPATLDYFGKHSTTKDKLRSVCKICRRIESKAYDDAHIEQRKQQYQEHKEEISEKVRQYRITHNEEVRAKQRQYYQDNREHRRELNRQNYRRHREEYIEKQNRYHWEHREQNIKKMRDHHYAHREEYIERDKRYYETHKDQRLAYEKQRRGTHAEQIREQRRAYHKTERHRIMHRATWHRREARKRAIEGTLTHQQIQAKLKAQKYTCYYCSTQFEKRKDDTYIFHLEHTIPLSRPEHEPRHDINYVVLSCPPCNLKKQNRLPHEFFEGGRLL